MELLPSVVQAVAGENFTVYAYFNDGSVRLADIKPMIAKGGVFAPLADETFFRERLTVMNGAVAWDIAGNRDNIQGIARRLKNELDEAKKQGDVSDSDPRAIALRLASELAAQQGGKRQQKTNEPLTRSENKEDFT